MSEPKAETRSVPSGDSRRPLRDNELAASIPGLIVGIVTAAISDLSAPLRLVVAALLAVVYWSWPRLAAMRRRRTSPEAPASTTLEPGRVQERPRAASGAGRLLSGRGRLGRWTLLAVALALAIVLNVLALMLVGGSLVALLFVVAWLLALALPLWLAHLSESLRSVLYQATAVSVGAALTIGAQPIVHPSQGKVRVPATADIFAAGQTSVPDMPQGGGTLPPGRSVTEGGILRFVVTGTVTCDPQLPLKGPDGQDCVRGARISSFGAISGVVDYQASYYLVGVFTTDRPPGSPPPSLDFSAAAIGHNFLALTPALNQVFFIGDGKASADYPQRFIVPQGGTHLYLGFADACGVVGTPDATPGCYDDNGGLGFVDVRVRSSSF
jgi:hypothetical protein